MCCMCRVRFLCSAYRLVHHGSARHPCARGPWRDVVLAPLSITLRLPKPVPDMQAGACAVAAGVPSLLAASPASQWWRRQQAKTSVNWMVLFEHVFLYLGPSSPHDLCGPSFVSWCCGGPRALRKDWRRSGNNGADRRDNEVGLDPTWWHSPVQWYLGQSH